MIQRHQFVINCPSSFDGEPSPTCNCATCTANCDHRGSPGGEESPLVLNKLNYAEFCSPGLVQNAVEKSNRDTYDFGGGEDGPMMLSHDRESAGGDVEHSVPGLVRPLAAEQEAMEKEQARRIGLGPELPRSFHG